MVGSQLSTVGMHVSQKPFLRFPSCLSLRFSYGVLFSWRHGLEGCKRFQRTSEHHGVLVTESAALAQFCYFFQRLYRVCGDIMGPGNSH